MGIMLNSKSSWPQISPYTRNARRGAACYAPAFARGLLNKTLGESEISDMMNDMIKKILKQLSGRVIATAVAALALSACNSTDSTLPLASPLSSPLAKPASLSYAKPSVGKGGATGRLVSMANGQELGYVGGDLYLGAFLPGSKADAPPMVAFSTDSDPKAVVYQTDGQFAFTDIAPGTYTLIVWNPNTSFVVERPGQGAVKVVIEPDKTIDLGTLTIQ